MESKTLIHLKGAEFDKEILQSSTPAVVDFYADWCGPCRMVSPIIEQLSQEYNGKVKFAKLNTDENPELAERYGILSIPTVMVFKNGKVAASVVGAGPASMYRQKIDGVLKG